MTALMVNIILGLLIGRAVFSLALAADWSYWCVRVMKRHDIRFPRRAMFTLFLLRLAQFFFSSRSRIWDMPEGYWHGFRNWLIYAPKDE